MPTLQPNAKMVRKRNRVAHSCVDCRRRKVRCDRTTPVCVRCQKAGKAHSCKYVPYGASETVSAEHLSESTLEGVSLYGTDDAESPVSNGLGVAASALRAIPVAPSIANLRQSEMAHTPSQVIPGTEYVDHASLNEPSRQQSRASKNTMGVAKTLSSPKRVLLRGSGFKTYYYGPSHYASLLLAFDELSNSGKELMHHFMVSVDESKKVKGQLKAMDQQVRQEIGAISSEHGALLQLLPLRSVVDPSIRRYLEVFETTYRVLHVKSFWDQYEAHWQDPQASPTSFVVLLLLVLACVNCMQLPREAGYVGRNSVSQKQAKEWVTVSEAWLQSQSHKHVTLVMVQIRVLIFMAKRINIIKMKRAWNSAGDVLRFAMAAGFHREPSQVSEKISVFDQEMRRRLWATILELELQTAADLGMRPSIGPEDWDCRPPSNIDDEDFDESCQVLPSSRSLQKFTKTSFLCISNQSTALRIEALSFVNHIKRPSAPELVAQLDARLRRAIACIQSWLERLASSAKSYSELAERLAKLQILESLTLIHQLFATSTEDPEQHFFSRTAFRDAAASTLELYKGAEEADALTLCAQRNDLFRAGLCISYELCFEQGSGSTAMFNAGKCVELVENAAKILENRAMHVGEGFYPYWIIVTALSLVYSKQNPGVDKSTFARAAVQRLINNTETILKSQRPVVNPQSLVVPENAFPTSTQPPLLSLDDVSSPLGLSDVTDFQFDLDGFDTFNFPDFWGMGFSPEHVY